MRLHVQLRAVKRMVLTLVAVVDVVQLVLREAVAVAVELLSSL